MRQNVKIIAIDGPAASGKGTIARKLAQEFDYAFLDTGALYRAVGLIVVRNGDDPGDATTARQAACELAQNPAHPILKDPDLRGDAVAQAASKVSAVPEVRQALLDFQRHFAANPPHGHTGAVLDGRDIGTVVCPEAPVKIFVTASTEIRAERRWKELRKMGIDVIQSEVLADLKERDTRDRNRSAAPLSVADGAFVLDTTALSVEDATAQALAYAHAVLSSPVET